MQGIHIKNASGKTGSLVNGDLNLEDTVVDISKIVTTDVSEAALGKMGKTFTANATFTGIDNKIVMPGIVTALQLEVGDVIQFSNAIAQNNKPRTVESITDNNTIIVNYEHAGSRGNGSLKLTDETKSGASVKLLAKWFVAPIGLGQALVKTNRQLNTSYNNLTGRSIVISYGFTVGTSTTVQFKVNGEEVDSNPVGQHYSFHAVLSSGSEYSYNSVGNVPYANRWELR